MALTVQNIVDAVSDDMRGVLGKVAPDATLILEWVDRIQKDALHTSMYGFLNQATEAVVTVAGTSEYTLSAADIRRILSVYDRTFDRPILPLESLSQPTPQAEQVQPALGFQPPQEKITLANRTQRSYPEWYKLFTTNKVRFYPAPKYPGTIEVVYEKQVVTLTALGDTLVIPEDGKDMVVAGVNYMTANYLKRPEDAQLWIGVYQNLKQGNLVV